jgi:ferric-dicitrate binding protein FerR (iron transport regulator)
MARERPARRRALEPLEALDLSLEAELQTELSLRRAERIAERSRQRALRAARRRFVLAMLVLVGLVAGLAYLIVTTFNGLFAGA